MKKNLLLMVSAALVFSGVFTSCDKNDDDKVTKTTINDPNAPTFIWESNPDFDPCLVSLRETPEVKILMSIPNGIAELTCTISSDNDNISSLCEMEGIPVDKPIDLLYDDDMVTMLSNYGVNCGVQLIGKTSAEFDLTEVIYIIRIATMLYDFSVDFVIEVTDAEGLYGKCKITLYTEND